MKNVDLLALSRAARSELLMQERQAWLERVRAEFDAEYAYVCQVCGADLPEHTTGRGRDYCSRSCQMNAYRKRRREKVKTMRDNGMGEYVALQWKDYRTTFPWEERPPGVPKTTAESPRR